jgi:FMN-dependent NADH-azoreductase
MKLLKIDTSILAGGSVSREVTAAIVARLTEGTSDIQVMYRDLVAENIPHLTPASLPGDHPLSAMAGELDAKAQATRNESQTMLDEFLTADTVVIGVPMYNFTIPSQLKAWIDRIVVPGKSFSYGANGPEGLIRDKRVIVAITRGGFYGSDTAAVSAEHAESYIRTVFGFIGVTNPEFVLAEGLQAGEEHKARALKTAHEAALKLAA